MAISAREKDPIMAHEEERGPRWDLSSIYAGVDDPQIDRDVKVFEEMAEQFARRHRGALSTGLGSAIEDFSELEMLQNKIYLFLGLARSLDVTDPKVQTKAAAVEQSMQRVSGEHLEFFAIELVALDEKVLASLYASDERVKRHEPWIEYMRVFRAHYLSEPVEAALTKRASFGPEAWGEFFDEFEADMRFPYDGKNLTLSEALHALTESADRDARAAILKTINDAFKGHFEKYAAQTLYMVAGSASVERAERGYRHPMDARNKSNRISDKAVDALHAAVMEEGAPLAQRFYRLKARLLRQPRLSWSDRNARVPDAGGSKEIPFAEGFSMVVSAYEEFSPTLAGLIREAAAGRRIDAPAVPGKRSGAFNWSAVLPGGVPDSYTFLNYLGSSRDVMTLAHELGHGVHGVLAGAAQGPLMSHAPIAYAETASVFGELTVFRHLLAGARAEGDDAQLLALIVGKIDDIVNTVVRQIGFSNFERRLHGMDAAYEAWEPERKLSPKELSLIWMQTLTEMYGPEGDTFTYADSDRLWAYISHFHRPFYVYGYAFGELLTHSLYAKKDALGGAFEPLYLDMLRSGGTKDAVALLAPFGLDPTDPSFWRQGIQASLTGLIEEAESIAARLGY